MRVRENKIILYCSDEQKSELAKRADSEGLSPQNYLRLLLGWPIEKQGKRKDLSPIDQNELKTDKN